MCELSRSFGYYSGKSVAVRGVYYQGLREKCPFDCFDGRPWPAAVDLTWSENTSQGPRVAFDTDEQSWNALDRLMLDEARKGSRIEIWVTVIGELRANPQSPLDPCVRSSVGYGHLGGMPAQIVVRRMTNVVVKLNPASTYDYGIYLRPRAK